jgi:hypothetical protein
MPGKLELPTAPLRQMGGEAQLNDLSLVQAFKKFVIEDLVVIELGWRATQVERGSGSIFENGQFPGLSNPWRWPVVLDGYDLPDRFMHPGISYPGYVVPKAKPEVRVALEALADRYSSLIEALSAGGIIACGTFAKTGAHGPVDRLLWSRTTTWIDVRDGDLLEAVSNECELLWRGLILRAADELRDRNVRALKSQGGAPTQYPWDDFIDETILRIGKQGLPETQTELIHWIEEMAPRLGSKIPDESTIRHALATRIPKTMATVKKR